MQHRRLTGALVAGSLLLVGVSVRFLAAPAFIGTPDAVHIVVTDLEVHPPTHTVIFDHQFSSQASAVYNLLVSDVQLAPNDAQSCPAEGYPYYHYALTFFHLGVNVATATSDATGCEDITLTYLDGSTAEFFWETDTHMSFWIGLHQLVQAPEPINACVGDPYPHC